MAADPTQMQPVKIVSSNAAQTPATVTAAGALKVDASGTTIITSGTVNQGTGGSSAWKVDGSAVTQPVSAASLPLPTGAATEASLAKLTLGQASTTSGQTGALVLGAVTTAAPTYTTAQSNPLSLTTAGRVRVDGSGTTQAISGSVTANLGTIAGAATAANQTSQLTNEATIIANQSTQTANQTNRAQFSRITDGTNDASVDPTSTGLNTNIVGAPWSAALGAGLPSAYSVAGFNTAAGTVTPAKVITASPTSGEDGLVVRNIPSGTQAVSGTVTANIGTSGSLALDATLTGGTQKTKIVDTGGTNVASVSAAGAVKVDGSGVTQPVSGTVGLAAGVATVGAVTQGSGALLGTGWLVNLTDSSGLHNAAILASGGVRTSSDLAQGAVTSGQLMSLMGGAVTTAPPVYTDGKSSPLSQYTDGALRATVEQMTFVSTNNSSTANLAKTTTFTGTSDSTYGIGAVAVNFYADKTFTIQVQQSEDNSHWDFQTSYNLAASTPDNRIIIITTPYVRVLASNTDSSTTTFLRLQTVLIPIANSNTVLGTYSTTTPAGTESAQIVRNIPSGTQIVNTNGSIVRTQSYDQHTQSVGSGPVASSTVAATTTSILHMWHPSTVGVNWRITQVTVSWAGGTVAAGIAYNTVYGTRTTADGTGGTTPALLSYDGGYTVNANSVWRIGGTAPTRVATNMQSAVMDNTANGSIVLYQQDPAMQSEGLRCRSGVGEGYEVRVVSDPATAQVIAQQFSVTVEYVEN